MTIENLEARRMLSVSVHSGVLTITGSATAANTLTVGLSADGTHIVTSDNGAGGAFDKASIKRVIMEGGSAADTISVLTANGTLPVRVQIYAHAGKATINAGNGNALVSAGDGADTVT